MPQDNHNSHQDNQALMELSQDKRFQDLLQRLHLLRLKASSDRSRYTPGSVEDIILYHKIKGIDILFDEIDTVVTKEKVSQITNQLLK